MTRLPDFVPLPVLSGSSTDWVDVWLSMADGLAKHCPMPFSDALNMPVSFADTYYESKAWERRKKEIESQNAWQFGIAERLNTIITVSNR